MLLEDKNEHNSPFSYCSPTHSHNILLQIMSETGSVGLIIFVALYFYLLKYLLVKYNRIKHKLNENKICIYRDAMFIF